MNLDWVETADRRTLLGTLDVALDVREELGLSQDVANIPLFRNPIRFRELYPGDSPSIRDAYCDLRFKAAEHLQKSGVFRSARLAAERQGWDSRLLIQADAEDVRGLVEVIQERLEGLAKERRTALRGGLSLRTIGIVRGLLHGLNRGTIKQVLTEAGGRPERVLPIPVVDRQDSPDYWSRDQMLTAGFDSMFLGDEREDAPGIVLNLVRAIRKHSPDKFERMSAELEQALQADGLELAAIVVHERTETSDRTAALAESLGLEGVGKLIEKAWRKVDTEPDSAITAAASSLETILHAILKAIDVPPPARLALPEMLVSVRRESNLDDLFPFGERSGRVTKSMSALAQDLYALAHQASDRHGGPEQTPTANPDLAYLFVGACDILGSFLLQMLKLGRLSKKATRESGRGRT